MYRDMVKLMPEEILVYLRRSRSDDPSMTVEEVLEKHETKLREWMDANLDAQVPEENWYREIVSGETIHDRIEFQKILKRIESDKIKAVLCIDCARISRGDLEECGRIIKLFRFTSTPVITPDRSYDLRDEFEREGFERELKNGNYYLEYSKKLMRRGKEYAVSMGAYVASVPPYGYELTRVQVGKKKLPSLKIDEDKAKVVRMIYDWYVNEDIGHQRIASRLDEMGIKPTRVSHWNSKSIAKILSNEHYLGKIKYFANKIDYVVENQEVKKKKVAVEDYQLQDGMHEPIIDDDIFYRAKAKSDKNPKIKYGLEMRNPLSSLLYCECGHAMTYCTKRGIRRYECGYQRLCHNASSNADKLIQEVVNALKQSMDDFSVDVCSSNEEAIKRQEEKIAGLEKRLKDIEFKELALWEKYTEDNMPKSVFEALRGKYEAEKEDLENLLRVAVNEMPQKIDYEERTARFHDALEALNDDSVSASQKNKLLRACINRIEYKREQSYHVPIEKQEKGKKYVRGWYQTEVILNIDLKI